LEIISDLESPQALTVANENSLDIMALKSKKHKNASYIHNLSKKVRVRVRVGVRVRARVRASGSGIKVELKRVRVRIASNSGIPHSCYHFLSLRLGSLPHQRV
jgi:hypothetical protein